GELAVGMGADVTLRGAEELRARGAAAGELAHVEVEKLAAEGRGQLLGEIALAGAGRAGEQKHADRLAALLQGRAAPNLRRQVVADLVLPDDLRLQDRRQRGGIDVRRVRLPGDPRF